MSKKKLDLCQCGHFTCFGERIRCMKCGKLTPYNTEQVYSKKKPLSLYLANFLAAQRGFSSPVTPEDTAKASSMADEILTIIEKQSPKK